MTDFTAPFQIFQDVWEYSTTTFSTEDEQSFVFRQLWIVGYEGGRKEKLFSAVSCAKMTALLKGK